MKNTQLEYFRKERGITQQQLAYQLGVSRQIISDWERGKAYPSVEKLILISDLYDVSLDYLIKGIKTNNDEVQNGVKENNIESIFKISNFKNTNSFVLGRKNKMYVSIKENEEQGSSLVIGSTATGKTRGIIIPNIYQMIKRNESGIIMDCNTELYKRTADDFLRAGYEIKILNFSNYKQSVGWNILQFLADIYKKDIFYYEKYIRLVCDSLFEKNAVQRLIFKTIVHEIITNDDIKNNISTLFDLIKYSNVDGFMKHIQSLDKNDFGFMLNLTDVESVKDGFYKIVFTLEKLLNNQSCVNILNTNEFNMNDIINKKTVIFIQHGIYDENISILNGLFIDLAVHYVFDNSIDDKKINLFFDECGLIFKYLKTTKYIIKNTSILKFNTVMCFQSLSQLLMTDTEIKYFVNMFNNVIYLGTYSSYDLHFFSKLFDMDLNDDYRNLIIVKRNSSIAYELTKDLAIDIKA